ncbi:MAG: hypothetical protein ABL878_15070 [Burkholderiales bacterium]
MEAPVEPSYEPEYFNLWQYVEENKTLFMLAGGLLAFLLLMFVIVKNIPDTSVSGPTAEASTPTGGTAVQSSYDGSSSGMLTGYEPNTPTIWFKDGKDITVYPDHNGVLEPVCPTYKKVDWDKNPRFACINGG